MSVVYKITVCCCLWFYCCTSGNVCPQSCRCSTDPNFSPGELTNCSYLRFAKLPGNIPEDTTTALFKENRLSHVKNFSFAALNKMLILDLSLNCIQILDEYAFVGLSNLIKLDLSGNCLFPSPDVFPEKVFMFLGSLKALNLDFNHYDDFSSESGLLGNSSVVNYFDKSVKSNSQERRQLFSRYNKEKSSRELNKLSQNNGKINAPKLNVLPMKIDRLQRNAIRPLPTSTDYPDKALSYLTALNDLSIDLIPHKTLGTGLRNLTLLNYLGLYCDYRDYHYNLTNETFVNVPHIKTLEIHLCNIEMIDVNSFSILENLSSYDMSRCMYNLDRWSVLFHSLTQNKIRTLDISNINQNRNSAVTLKSDHLKYFRNLTSLQSLHAGNNNIKGFEKGVLCTCVPKPLKEVYLDGNILTFQPHYLEEFKCLKNLELLSIMDFSDSDDIFFPFWKNNDEGMKKRDLFSQPHTNRNIRSVNEIILPPKLKFLFVTLSGLMSHSLCDVPFDPHNSLQRVYAGHNYFHYWSRCNGLDSLVELYLEDVSCDSIDLYFFTNFNRLTVLDISGNPFKYVDKFHFGKTLKNLSMSRIGFSAFNDDIFRHLHNLEFLDWSENRIRKFEYNISHMVKLKFLNLSGNNLNTLPKHVRDHLDSLSEKHNVTVDLTFNPIACVCENIDFLKWIRDSKVTFVRYTDYTCVHESEGLPKQTEDIFGTITRLERECNSYAGMFFGAAASCLVVLIILGTALAYRFRWKLRYLYYATRLNFKRQSLSDHEDFHFDAFVSFSSEDTGFVMGEMKTRLEDDLGLMLCIHTRDFMPGQYIASNILDAIQKSRHTMLVLTRALLESDWCNYELQMALMEGAQTGRDVLLFLLYEDIPNSDLPREIIFNIQSHTYLEFPHTEDDRELFWNRLAESLRG